MSRAHVSLLTLLVACGDDGGNAKVDAGNGGNDTMVTDAPSDCDYVEQSDLTNDTTEDGTTESTGLTLSNRAVICGVFESTHFDNNFGLVDVDSFTFSVAAETDVIVRLLSPSSAELDYISLDVYPAGSTSPIRTLDYYGNHGVVSVHLPAGSYELLPFAGAGTPATMAVTYQLEVVTDTPNTRCAELTTGGFTEAGDGAQDTGNDVIAYPMNAAIALTASTADAPEATNIVIAPDFSNRIVGESADVTATDRYEDKDTYLFATGTGTNELTVRLDWTGTTDLDWILYEKNTTTRIGFGLASSTTGPEMKLFAVKPNTEYWLTVLGALGTQNVAYNVTLCGDQFTP